MGHTAHILVHFSQHTHPPWTLCMVSASISVQHVRCFSMVLLICAYVHFRLFLEFRGLKIANLKIRDGGRVQSEGPIDDNLIWGNCDLHQTFCIVKKKISDHIHLFVSAKGRKLYGSKCFFTLQRELIEVRVEWWRISRD